MLGSTISDSSSSLLASGHGPTHQPVSTSTLGKPQAKQLAGWGHRPTTTSKQVTLKSYEPTDILEHGLAHQRAQDPPTHKCTGTCPGIPRALSQRPWAPAPCISRQTPAQHQHSPAVCYARTQSTHQKAGTNNETLCQQTEGRGL